jgi:hypothetical protein
MKYQKSLSKVGFTRYVDKRGLSKKAKRAVTQQTELDQIIEKTEIVLARLKVRLTRNPLTIVSGSYFDRLGEIIENCEKMWDEVSYPFKEQLLVRTCKINVEHEISMPLMQIDLEGPEETAEYVRSKLGKLGDPDQLLLHPRLRTKTLEKEMIRALISYKGDEVEIDFGVDGSEHIKIELCKNIFRARMKDEFEMEILKGRFTKFGEETYRRIMLASKIFLPFFEHHLIPEENKHKQVVYEFRVLPHQGYLYMILNDYEVV